MFTPLSRFFRRTDPAATDHPVVAEFRIAHPREPRSRRCERVLAIGWVLVLAKCVAVWWLCRTYPEIEVGAGWVIAPTLFFASLCTVLYWRRD